MDPNWYSSVPKFFLHPLEVLVDACERLSPGVTPV